MSFLRPHQSEGTYRAVTHLQAGGKGFYLDWEPGMGKCLGGLVVTRMTDAKRVLVVCPPRAIGVWRREIIKWWPTTDVDFRFVSFERLIAPTKSTKKSTATRRKNAQATLAQLLLSGPNLLIVDEAHHTASPSAKTTKAVWKLAEASGHVLYLSGTPVHDPLGYWSQYRVIDPANWRSSFTTYKEQVGELHPDGWVKKFKPGAVARVQELIAPVTHHATIDQLDIPRPDETVVPFTLETEERVNYDSMAEDLLVELGDGAIADADLAITKLLRLCQITSGHITSTAGVVYDIGWSKLDATLELIDERPTYKIIVACRFREEITRLEQELRARKRPVMTIVGGMSEGAKQGTIANFQNPDLKADVLLVQYQAGGESDSMTAARCMILYSVDPSTIRYRQMIGRMWREGQHTNTQILIPCAEDTIDEAVYQGVRDKLDTISFASRLKEALHA